MKNKLFFIGKAHLIDYPTPLECIDYYNQVFSVSSGIFALIQVIMDFLVIHYIFYIGIFLKNVKYILWNMNNDINNNLCFIMMLVFLWCFYYIIFYFYKLVMYIMQFFSVKKKLEKK